MKKMFLRLLSLACACSVLVSCGGKGPSSDGSHSGSGSQPPQSTTQEPEENLTPQKGGILKIGLEGTPKSLDPKNRTNTYESRIIMQIAETLISYSNDQSEYLPCLATSWTISEDGLEYTFQLREDAHFHPSDYQDGRLMTAEDVKYSLERAKEAKNVTLVMLDHVEVLDEFSVKCVLNEANAIFMDALTGPTNVIVAKEDVEGYGDMFGEHLIGTGPFRLIEFKLDDYTSIERNDSYWGAEPYLDGAIFKIITDTNQHVNGLKSGEIDLSCKISGEAVQLVENDPNLTLMKTPNTGINFIGFNTESGITTDVRVRQALAQAVDLQDLCLGLYQYGEADFAGQPMPPASWGYDPSMDALKQVYDPENAKALLADAGYPDGFSITITLANSSVNSSLATILQSYWKTNLNVDLKIDLCDWSVYSQAVTSGNFEIYVVGVDSTVDPHNFTGKCLGSSYIGTLPAGCRLNNPEMDALIAQSLSQTDQSQRKSVYQDIVALTMELQPAIYFSNSNLLWGTNGKVHGLSQKTYWYLCNNEVNVWMEQ